MRRHMATHYNEPVDIASSSLTEEGTVFGGESNLIKGLHNLIELYHPEVIGVGTTCLAETIGEDVGAIIARFYEQNPDVDVKILNIVTPGYGGTQNEGWFATLRAIVEQVEQDRTAHGGVNIVTPMISPADTRWLKRLLTEMGLEYTLLPDISENLDGATEKHYNKLKCEGTSLEQIATMAGARLTIEFSEFTDAHTSPAEYLCEHYGVAYEKLPLPVGIRAMDRLVEVLKGVGGTLTRELEKERGRYLDAMVDSHKYCARARAAIYGEPDFVAAVVRLCAENGVLPALVATGSVAGKLKDMLADELEACRDFAFGGETVILDDCDFSVIERHCREQGVNLLIGSSDGRRIAHKMNIPLIRCAFPIHDHVGGQRVRMLGFDGSLNLLDQSANAMLSQVENSFRTELHQQFFVPSPWEAARHSGLAPESVAGEGERRVESA
jgi:nitrogenase molybdenum-iron protein alpha/beta subunit